MSTKEFLTNILGLPVLEERPGCLAVSVPREKFAEAIDELVNARGLTVEDRDDDWADGSLVGIGLALAHLFASDDRVARGTFGVHALLHDDTSQTWLWLSTHLPADDPTYPSVARRVMAAYWFERCLGDLYGIKAVGHPDPRGLVHDGRTSEDFWSPESPAALRAVSGEGVCEISLGPVDGGLDQAVQFRFNVAGERIITLESRLFYTHKGLEKLLEGKTLAAVLPLIERLVGEAAPSHTLAFVQAVETLAECPVSDRALGLRCLLNELERVTLHLHDLASIGGLGAGYTVLSTHGFRLKEQLQRLYDDLFGNRWWRGLIVPGGLSRDVNANELQKINVVVTEAIDEMLEVVALAVQSDGWRDRLEAIGVLSREAVFAYGAVGLTARASGLDRDVRRDHPYAAYDRFVPTVNAKVAGDVYARFMMRVDELKASKELIQDICKSPGEGRHLMPCEPKDGRAFSAVEGGRGETLHVLYLKNGLIERYTVRDPSFCDWPLLDVLCRDNLVSDFPLCNLSLGLSVPGTDL